MLWQDIVFSVGSIVFSFALVPSIMDRFGKPNTSTSLTTAIVLSTYVVCFFSLGLFWSGIFSTLTAVGWYILFFQKMAQNKRALGIAY
jgi:hypothetical protein